MVDVSGACLPGHGHPALLVVDGQASEPEAFRFRRPAQGLNDPVDGMPLGLEDVVEAAFDELPIPVEELAVHVDGLVERVAAPRLLQEAHQREVAARGGHLARAVGRRSPNAVEQGSVESFR